MGKTNEERKSVAWVSIDNALLKTIVTPQRMNTCRNLETRACFLVSTRTLFHCPVDA